MTLPRRGCSFLAVLRYASAESAASVAGFYKVDFFSAFRHSQDYGPDLLDGIRTRTHDKGAFNPAEGMKWSLIPAFLKS